MKIFTALTASATRFNDNRRLHIFVVDIETQQVHQLTEGTYYEHSIDWSPNGEEIVFVSNREPDPDRFFNNDLFTVKVGDGTIRRVLGDLLENDSVVSISDEEEFVAYVVDHLGEPPEVYSKIRLVNLGLTAPDPEMAKELEVGRNECALSE